MNTVGFIGGGNMAQALIEGILKAELFEPASVWVSDVNADRLAELRKKYGIQTSGDNAQIVRQCRIVVLSIKPQAMGKVLDGVAGQFQQGALVISIAAGITTQFIQQRLGSVQVIRVMPNTPALVGAGASGLYAANASKESADEAVKIFASVGKAVQVDSEDLINTVTAVSGSGPAYFFMLMEEMIRAGVELGLDEGMARDLVLQTVKGAALLAEAAAADGEGPAQLRKKVTSPNGTTEAAIKTFKARGFDPMVLEALTAARNRGRELAG